MMYSTVVLDECFALDESPSRSANVISWGPHNVLSVCTKWIVKLYLATLRQDAAQIIIRHHPLCHRHDKQSLEVIHSARWAPSLLHEIHYPATARLCVATSANVVVYRVSRHGNHSVSVSHGVGIAVTHPNLARVTKLQEQKQQQMENYKNDVLEESAILESNMNNSADDNDTKHNKRSRKQETCSRSNSEKREKGELPKSNAKVSKAATRQTKQRKNIRQHRQQKRQTTERQRRQIKIDSESESDSDDSGYSTSSTSSLSSELSSESSSSDNKTSVHTKSTPSNQKNQIRFTLIDYHWLDYEQLLIVTNAGVHVVSLWNNFSDEESEQILTLPQEPHYTLVQDTLGVHALFIACTCLCKIDNIHREVNSCNGSRSTYLLLLASPFVIRVLLVTSHDPLELCKPSNSCTLDNTISNSEYNDARSVTVNVVGLHYVEIQTMNSVPASLCCYVDDNDDHRNKTDWSHPSSSNNNDAHHKEEEECAQLLNEVSRTNEEVQEYAMKVGAIISSPNETIRGTFEVRINSNTLASTMVRNVAPLKHSKERLQSVEECNRQHTLITSEWRLNARFDLSLLANETALRSLHLVDLSSVELPLTEELAKHNLSGKTPEPLSLSSRYFMIGLTRHYVFGFTSQAMQPILLFQCPSLASAFKMPLHSALAVSGIAIHASCTLALLLLQNGQVNSVSMFIKPNCVNDTNGLLSRMLHLCGMNSSHEKNANSINFAQRDYRKGEVNTTRTSITTVNNNYSNTSLSQSLSYSLSQHNSLQRALWERQRSYSFFIWEQLFASDAECVSLRLYSEEYKKLMHYDSSNANNVNTKYNDKGLLTLSRNVLSCHYYTIEALCKRYLELRDEYSVDLYLRHVMPTSEEAFTQCLHKRHDYLSIASTNQCNRATSSHDFVTNNVEHWQWWELLLAIWRRAPCNVWCLYEIILANALLIVAKYTHYANFDLTSDEIFEQTNDKCSTNAQTLSYCGAVTFVQMYIAHEMERLSIQENKTVFAQNELLLTMDLEKSRKWVKQLSEWLEHYCADILCTHGTCLQHEIVTTTNTHENQYCCTIDNSNTSSKYSLIGKYLFPCSLCDAKGVAKLTPAFSYDVLHSSHEQHTTIFSPKTFSALSMLSDEAVLTKCRDCGFRDYAHHALCVICGGVLV